MLTEFAEKLRICAFWAKSVFKHVSLLIQIALIPSIELCFYILYCMWTGLCRSWTTRGSNNISFLASSPSHLFSHSLHFFSSLCLSLSHTHTHTHTHIHISHQPSFDSPVGKPAIRKLFASQNQTLSVSFVLTWRHSWSLTKISVLRYLMKSLQNR